MQKDGRVIVHLNRSLSASTAQRPGDQQRHGGHHSEYDRSAAGGANAASPLAPE